MDWGGLDVETYKSITGEDWGVVGTGCGGGHGWWCVLFIGGASWVQLSG